MQPLTLLYFSILLNFLSLPVAVHAFSPARLRIHVWSISLLRTQGDIFLIYCYAERLFTTTLLCQGCVCTVLRLRLDGYSSGL
jgi:hypothetical protein